MLNKSLLDTKNLVIKNLVKKLHDCTEKINQAEFAEGLRISLEKTNKETISKQTDELMELRKLLIEKK